MSADPLVKGTDPVVPAEVREILIDFARKSESGQVILNLNAGTVESYKTVRYVRVIDKGRGGKGK